MKAGYFSNQADGIHFLQGNIFYRLSYSHFGKAKDETSET